MPTVDVVNLNNEKVGSVELSEAVFGAAVNEALLWESVKHQLAAQRSGTAKTKVRREVAGSGKKLWRQKGTGRARVGSVRSPLWRHGGTTHGPVPRSYDYKLPKKMILGALKSALSAKLRDGEITVVRDLALADHRTKTMHSTLSKFSAANSCLLVDAGDNRNLALGSRNLPHVKAVDSKQLTTYDLLGHKRVLLTETAAKKLSEGLA
ncbi:MAG: 50S ribosomal protein L4 [Acidobacteria bacterium]|nr:50S ribosomal protein L4 [Acidobacteriota bacterium]